IRSRTLRSGAGPLTRIRRDAGEGRVFGEGGQGARRAAELGGQGDGGQAVAGAQDSRQPGGGLQPEGGGDGLLAEGAGGHQGGPVPFGEPGQGGHDAVDVGEDGGNSAAGDQHGGGVQDVLA